MSKDGCPCTICGRHLKHPDSVAAGMGPVCRGVPNKMRKRFNGRVQVLPGYYISVNPANQDLIPTLNLIKLFSFCFSCKHFNVHEGSSRTPYEVNTEEAKERFISEVRPVVSIPYDSNKEFAFPGLCTHYRLNLDGNRIVICPYFWKRIEHKLNGNDKIELIAEDGSVVVLTGKEIYDIKARLKQSRVDTGRYQTSKPNM